MWMDLKGVVLSEKSQTEKSNTVRCHLSVESKKYNKLINIIRKEVDPQTQNKPVIKS